MGVERHNCRKTGKLESQEAGSGPSFKCEIMATNQLAVNWGQGEGKVQCGIPKS